ncbi:unnamed protein product [Amoebophrya sp. A120]|nr:unnamed protein product [Amoebophrya sp. A120]|eukprot:GSA120T00020135001.1
MATAAGDDASKASDAQSSRPTAGGGTTTTKDVYTYGQHEPLDYYLDCYTRERNRGLYTANRNVRNDRGATATRQNNNGERHGLECPEERDYYPYWHPSPWHDIAIFTSEKRCNYFREHSQNVVGKHYCRSTSATDDAGTGVSECAKANNEFACMALTSAGGQPLGCAWTEFSSWDEVESHYSSGEEGAPECYGAYKTRDNHNGNYGSAGAGGGFQSKINGQASHYVWKVPDYLPANEKCVFRIRYNITTLDFVGVDPANKDQVGEDYYDQVDASWNGAKAVVKNNERSDALRLPRVQSDASTCKDVVFTADNQNVVRLSPGGAEGYEKYYGCDPITNVEQTILSDYRLQLQKTPSGTRFGSSPVTLRCCQTNVARLLTVNANENQMARTFQDRSHAFVIRERPSDVSSSARIVNYNVRGRRGNIVQVYPAVEYDFVPPDLEITSGDYLHFQWAMSDANNRGNAGNGRAGTDRANLVQVGTINVADAGSRGSLLFSAAEHRGGATKLSDKEAHTLFCDYEDTDEEERAECEAKIIRFAYLGQTVCTDRNNDQAGRNCAQLNSAGPYFNYGRPLAMTETGTFFVKSTRNDDFSNRSQKARITVRPFLSPLEWFFIILGSLVLLAVPLFLICLVRFQKRHPGSEWSANRFRVNCCLRRALGGDESEFTKWLEERRAILVGRHERFQRSKSVLAKEAVSSVVPPHPGRKRSDPSLSAFVGNALCGCCRRKKAAAAAGSGDAAKPNKPPSSTPTTKVEPVTEDGKATPAATTTAWRATGEGEDGRSLGTLHIKGQILLAVCFFGSAVAGWLLHLEMGYHGSQWYCCAKAGGYVLNLSCSLLTLPMLRFLASAMRQSPLRMFVLEDPVGYHKFIAKYGIGCGVILHVLGHVMHTIEVTSGESYWYDRDLFIEPPSIWHEYSGLHWAEYFLFFGHRGVGWTGVILLLHLFAIVIFALDYTRRRSWHCPCCRCCVVRRNASHQKPTVGPGQKAGAATSTEAATHQPGTSDKDVKPLCNCCGIPWVWKVVDGYRMFWIWHSPYSIAIWYGFIVVHAPHRFLIWMFAPVMLIVADHILGKESQSPYAVLHSATLAKGDTLKLHFARPPGFVYEAGQYAEIWWRGERHPFTICSAPEENVLSFAIRAKDDLDWCSALRRRLINYSYELEHFSGEGAKEKKPDKWRGPPCGTQRKFAPGVTSKGVLYSMPVAAGGSGSAYRRDQKLCDPEFSSEMIDPPSGKASPSSKNVYREGAHKAVFPVAPAPRGSSMSPWQIKSPSSELLSRGTDHVLYQALTESEDVTTQVKDLGDHHVDAMLGQQEDKRKYLEDVQLENVDADPGASSSENDRDRQIKNIFGRNHYDFLQSVEGVHWAAAVDAINEKNFAKHQHDIGNTPDVALNGLAQVEVELQESTGAVVAQGDLDDDAKERYGGDGTSKKEALGPTTSCCAGVQKPSGHQAGPAVRQRTFTEGDADLQREIEAATLVPPEAIVLQLGGPFGAPAQNMWHFDTVLMVGTGIGITPFAAMLRSVNIRLQQRAKMMQNLSGRDVALAKAGTSSSSLIKPSTQRKLLAAKNERMQKGATTHLNKMNAEGAASEPENINSGTDDDDDMLWTTIREATKCPSKLHLVWSVRSQDEFQWFYDVLVESVNGPAKDHVVINLFQTGEISLSERVPINCEFHEFAGRPDWRRIFQKLSTEQAEAVKQAAGGATLGGGGGSGSGTRPSFGLGTTLNAQNTARKSQRAGDVGVFLCGSPAVGVELKAQCQKCSQGPVRFHYFAESF